VFHINVWLTVKVPHDAPRVRDLLAQCVRGSRAEAGCVRFDAFYSQTDPNRFLLVETWRTKADWEAHRTRKTVQEIYLPQVLPLVTRDAHECSAIE
jgi:quinol monooxygenase YgiN